MPPGNHQSMMVIDCLWSAKCQVETESLDCSTAQVKQQGYAFAVIWFMQAYTVGIKFTKNGCSPFSGHSALPYKYAIQVY